MGVTVKGDILDPGEFEDDGGPWKITLASCPQCHRAILGIEEHNDFGEWDAPLRLWPSPPLTLSDKIPKGIRESLEEAHKCLRAKAYTASIAMSGRALEAIGRHFYPQTEERKRPLMLKDALNTLAKDKIIDARLHEWGLALHSDRNLAAHPSGTHFKGQDARDVFKFANNICEYIFVLSSDFNEFEKRREERTKSKAGTGS